MKVFPPDEGVELAICGRSNSGKSSILNMLANEKTSKKQIRLVEHSPLTFQSMKILKKKIGRPPISHMPKPQKMQKEWGQQITKYMASRRSLRRYYFNHGHYLHPLQESDLNFIAWCEQYNLPMQILLNKSDKLSKK